MHPLRVTLPWLLFGLLVFGLAPASHARPATALAWAEPLLLADPAASGVAASPMLTIDGEGSVHVVWYSVLARAPERGGGLSDALVYRARTAGVWSAPEAIYTVDRTQLSDTSSPLASDAALRNPVFALDGSLTSAPDGRLHLAFGDRSAQRYLSASWRAVVRDANLLPAFILGAGPASGIAAGADGTLHLALVAIPRGSEEVAEQAGGGSCNACLEVLYRRSTSGGVTWARPENLSRLDGEDAHPRLGVDGQGGVHLLWDHLGLEPSAEPPFLLYQRSPDGGQSWGEPLRLGAPGEGSLHATLGVGLGGQLLVVYGGMSTGSVFFQSSLDGGLSWSPPGLVPGVVSPGLTGSEPSRFSLAVDGAGRQHLLMVGSLPADGSTGQRLLHLSWDGERWSAAEALASGGAAPGSPRLQIERGNRLHAVWTTTELGADGFERQLVWYSDAPLEAPELAPPPTFTTIPTIQPTATPVPTVAPTPTLLPAEARRQETVTGPPRWEGESLQVLAVALGPVLILIGAVVWWSTRRGRDDE